MDRYTKLNMPVDIQPTREFIIDKDYTKKCIKRRSYTRVKIYLIYLGIVVSVALPNIFPIEFNSSVALIFYMFASSYIFPVIASSWLVFGFWGIDGEPHLVADLIPNPNVVGLIDDIKSLLAFSVIAIPISIGCHQTRIPMFSNLLLVYELLVFIYCLKKDCKKGIDNTKRLIAKDFKIDIHSKTYYEDISTIVSDINRLIR